MSERHGENEGFFDKVKDFFTGESRAEEGSARHDDHLGSEEHVQTDRTSDEQSHEPTTEDHHQNEHDDHDHDHDHHDHDHDGHDHDDADTVDRDDALDPGADGLGSHDAVGAAEAEQSQRGESSDSLGDAIVDQSRGTEVFDENPATGGATDDDVAQDRWDGSGEVPETEVPQSEAIQRHIDQSGGADAYAARHSSDDVPEDTDDRADVGPSDAADTDDAAETDDHDDSDDQGGLVEDEDSRREREEAFAREHDAANHDVVAGEEFRQPGDWAAGEDGPQVQEADGTVHDFGSSEAEGLSGGDQTQGGDAEPSREATGWDAGDSDPGDSGGGHGLRESSLEEVRDGGHGWGSAAPIGPDVMPIGHPVKAWYDTGSFVCKGDAGYDGAQPDVWFTDAETAQNAGFRHGLGD